MTSKVRGGRDRAALACLASFIFVAWGWGPAPLVGQSLAGVAGIVARSRAATQLHLEPCSYPGSAGEARCGTFTVPENRSLVGGRTIDLRLVVLPALKAGGPGDPIFLLAGGPGQAATSFGPGTWQVVPRRLRRQRDIVLVDQRGTGGSNGLQCPTRTLQDLLRALAFEFPATSLRRCRDTLDADLTQYTTPIAIDDLDDVRTALGYEQINLWGGSYGTSAALVYLRRHPERVRTAVLRGVAPLDLTLPLFFARDAQAALERLAGACERDSACAAAFPDLEETLASVLEALEREPARIHAGNPVTGKAENARLTRDAFAGGIRLLQYGTPFSRLIPIILARASRGDFRPFLQAVLPLESQIVQGISIGMYLSVVCTEHVPWLSQDLAAAAGSGAYLGASPASRQIEACAEWPKGELPPDFREPVRSDVPVLLISGDEDPVTPPRWAEEILPYLSKGRHLVLPRTGHLPSLPGCAAELAAGFVEKGSADRLDLGCVREITRPPFVIPKERKPATPDR